MRNSKWADFKPSIFTTMTNEAVKAGAINLAQGFPDFDGPHEIKAAAIAAIEGRFNQYAPSAGYPQLRAAIAQHYCDRLNQKYSPDDEITVFSGATEALFCAALALLDPGDELLTFEPFYDSYPACALAAGAAFRTVNLQPPDWTFDVNELQHAISPKTKVLLLNNPHNPTGRVFTLAELEAIAELVRRHNLWVITDEVYEELTFPGTDLHHLVDQPGMRERTVMISSTSKTFSFTGWKVGYALAPAELTDLLRKIHQFVVFCSASPLQQAMISAFALPASYYTDLRAQYLARRDFLIQTLESVGFRCFPAQGTYFLLADFSHISDRTDTDFALWLTREVKVACIPISSLYLDQKSAEHLRYVRFGFCKDLTTLQGAREKLVSSQHL